MRRAARRPPGVSRGTPRVTRLGEIGLTAVVLAIPSSILTGTMGPYDEPKALALVILVGLTGLGLVAAWTFGATSAFWPKPDGAVRAVWWLLGAYGVWWVLATGLSIAPGQSLWGAFGRAFGLIAFLAVLAVFVIVQLHVHGLDHACHLIDVCLLGSVPVAVLALAQALGWDPLPPGWDPATADLRVRSTFGQHIFLGSYLSALIPLGIGRAMAARWQRERLQGPCVVVGAAWALGMVAVLGWTRHGPLAFWMSLVWSIGGATAWSLVSPSSRCTLPAQWRLAMLSGLVTAHALALVLSTARGALIGLLIGLAVASAIFLVTSRAHRTIALLGSGAAVLVLFVVALNVGVSSLERLKGVALFQRLGSIAELQAGSPGWVRLQLWRGILSRWTRQLAGEEVVPGPMPSLRSVIGYGPETQLLILDRFLPAELTSLRTHQRDWSALYAFDRAHNELLDHLLTTGIVGMFLWLGLVGGLVVIGAMRLRSAVGTVEAGVRLGCLATVLGQVVEGFVGIASPMPRALFWVAAAILTVPSPMPLTPAPTDGRLPRKVTARRRPSLPSLAILSGALVLTLIVIVGSARSLLGSMAYATGIRRGIAGDLATAQHEFVRASHLAPWVPFPAEAAADVSLRMMAAEPNATRWADWILQAQEALARARRHAPLRSELWRLSAQVGLASMRAGHPEQFGEALRAFSEAARLNPGNAEILAQWALALLQNGDPIGGRTLAEKALDSDRQTWLAWAVLARSYEQLGNPARARLSADEARRLAPEPMRRQLEKLLP
jgi:hypothetical protein